MAAVRLDLSFAALATRGHQVVWMRVHQPEHDMTTDVVLDATSGTVYCDEKMFGLFAHAEAANDPLALATSRGWELQERLEGSVTCAVVATSSADRGASIRTTLFVDTSVRSPYR
jgi:hypothetical protein